MAFNSLYLIYIRKTTVKAEPKVRIRIRGAITRIKTAETRIRTSSRISRQEGTPERHNPLFQRILINNFSLLRALSYAVRLITAQAEPKGRIRKRGAMMRSKIAETRIRTKIRKSRQEGTIPARGCCSRMIEIITSSLVGASTYSI